MELLYIFVAFMLFFLLICAIPHLICKCLSHPRLSSLYLRRVCCSLQLPPLHSSRLDYAFSISMHPSLLFLLFPRAQLPDVRHLHLSLVILHICCLPSSRHTCPLLVAPSPVFQLPRLTCAILHRVVSWTVELNGFFLFFFKCCFSRSVIEGGGPMK